MRYTSKVLCVLCLFFFAATIAEAEHPVVKRAREAKSHQTTGSGSDVDLKNLARKLDTVIANQQKILNEMKILKVRVRRS